MPIGNRFNQNVKRVKYDPVKALSRGYDLENQRTTNDINSFNLKTSQNKFNRAESLRTDLQGAQSESDVVDVMMKYDPVKAFEMKSEFSAASTAQKKAFMTGLATARTQWNNIPDKNLAWQTITQLSPEMATEFGDPQNPAMPSSSWIALMGIPNAEEVKQNNALALRDYDRQNPSLNIKQNASGEYVGINPYSLESKGTGVQGKPPSGMEITSDGQGGFTLKQGAGVGASKKTISKWTADIVQAQIGMDTIRNIARMYKPEYLSVKGDVKSYISNKMNYLDPTQRDQWVVDREKFISEADKQMLVFRKWATGVAGGERELNMIRAVTFSSKDNAQQFEAKISAAADINYRLQARLKAAVSAGIESIDGAQFQKYIKENPLELFPSVRETLSREEGAIVESYRSRGLAGPELEAAVMSELARRKREYGGF